MDSEGIVKESIGGERAIGAIITLLLWLETELKKKRTISCIGIYCKTLQMGSEQEESSSEVQNRNNLCAYRLG
jgi:hypothetical protein